MSGTDLTPNQAEVARLYNARWGVSEIAERLQVLPHSVATYAAQARRKGVAVPIGERSGRPRSVDWSQVAKLTREGKSVTAIAAALSVGLSTISRIQTKLREAGYDLPPKLPQGLNRRKANWDRVGALHATGLSSSQIAKRTGVAARTVRNIVQAIAPVSQVANQVTQDVANRAKAPTPLCMSCGRTGSSVSPRFYVCGDCKARAAGVAEGW